MSAYIRRNSPRVGAPSGMVAAKEKFCDLQPRYIYDASARENWDGGVGLVSFVVNIPV